MMIRIFCFLFLITSSYQAVIDHNHNYRESVPRFRNAHASRHEVYLGDQTRLDCQTYSKTPVVVEWYRNDTLIVDELMDSAKFYRDENRMVLIIYKIDVSDQGLWSCRVQNSYGQIMRNFTLEVIDFCDYFLIPEISRHRIPMECVCLWHYTREAQRVDVDYSIATHHNCLKYASRMISRARKPLHNIPCFNDNCTTDLPNFNPFPPGFPLPVPSSKLSDAEKNASHVTRVTLKKDDDELSHDGTFHDDKSSFDQTEYINVDDDEEELAHSKSISPDADLVELNITIDEPPHFKMAEPGVILNETHALPAGRTLKLNCKSAGSPSPKIVWFKNGQMLTRGSPRSGGYEYKFKRWSLELEDAVVADTGSFHCEAWNDLGTATKYFNVIIVNRMRRPPIIVPNILTSQTVNVNDTAKFTCKVVSDLLPHIMWVRINRVNGSYHYFNDSASEFMFNYTEMDSMENAHVHHVGDESSLTLSNVSLEDQGIYACLSGNSLGMTMANATLTVHDFVSIELLTGDEPKLDKWDTSSIMVVLLLIILGILVSTMAVYLTAYRSKFKKKNMMMDDTVGLVAKKKRVVVNKKPVGDDKDGASEMPSPYQIQIIEQPISTKEAGQRQRKRVNSENTVLSEYEVDSDPQWEVDRTRLSLVHMLGEGAFGEVWKAMLADPENPGEENATPVAVKKLKMSAHEKELIDLVSEMETFKVIGEHENVLRLIGCCTGSGPLYVVVELCRHGNLRDFLRAHRPKEEKANKKSSQDLADYLEPRKISDKQTEIDIIPHLTQRHLVAFAWQVARGMDFMAKKKIIHRDLAARNVLVADNHVLKISDFGLSRDVHCNDYYRKRGNGRLPIKWMALEALDSHVYTIESDVWSFGILLWEIMTLGGTPYPTIAMPELYATLKEGYRMEAPHNCPEEVYNIMVASWQEKRENRPSFSTIVDYLDWMLVQSVDTSGEGSDLHEKVFSENASASGQASPSQTLLKRRKHRPLSAPVNLPFGPQHSICDDDSEILQEIGDENDTDQYHFYCNDNDMKNTTSSPPTSLPTGPPPFPKFHDQQNSKTSGYVGPERLVRVVSGVANQSLDSAIGSPAWHSYDRSSNNNINGGGANASCLGQSPHYYNTAHEIQYAYFTFDPPSLSKEMTSSRDSAICEELYNSRYPYYNIQYSNIYIKKKINASLSKNMATKETIV